MYVIDCFRPLATGSPSPFWRGGRGVRRHARRKHYQKYMNQFEWPLWEVFIRSKQGLDHKHVGSLHAADATMAIQNARDVYTRRLEGVSIWVVESTHIHASNPDDAEAFFDPAADKVYRHPTFYDVPDSIKHM